MMEPDLANSSFQNYPQGENRSRRRKTKVIETLAGTTKRRLSDEQAKFLEVSFETERKLECKRKETLATELGLEPKQVAVWFQNRRAKLKGKQVEENYQKLKSEHDELVVETCQLEMEVLKLKERLSEREEEIGRLSGRMNRAENDDRSVGSSSTANHQAAAEEKSDGGQDSFVSMHDFMYSNNWMGWEDGYFGM